MIYASIEEYAVGVSAIWLRRACKGGLCSTFCCQIKPNYLVVIENGPKGPFLYRYLEATSGFEPLIGILQTPALTTWPRRQNIGAEDGIRTRGLLLGKEMLYR